MAQERGRDAVIGELRDRVVTGLHVGQLRGGERLPSVRVLATELDVNERVVLAALRALADEGLVEVRERSGTFVLPPRAPAGGGLSGAGQWLMTILPQVRALGLSPREVPEFVRRSLETRRVRAACIECNHDQIHLLCSELAEDHGYLTESVSLDLVDDRDPPAAVRRADVLVTTAFHAARVRRIARALNKPWLAVSLRADVMRDVARRLERGPVYYVATDARYERKLHRMLRPFGSTANLRVCVVPRDDVTEIPDDAPTFVMTSAREYVDRRYGGRGPGRPIQPRRHLSDASARQLLGFIVSANVTEPGGLHAPPCPPSAAQAS
jgi:DNA-binding transcriptional regulator YhcF (GntR family)